MRYNLVFILILTFTSWASSHDVDVGSCDQDINIRLIGAGSCGNSQETSFPTDGRRGKAGPKGEHGMKGSKGEAAAPCECITNLELFDKVKALES